MVVDVTCKINAHFKGAVNGATLFQVELLVVRDHSL